MKTAYTYKNIEMLIVKMLEKYNSCLLLKKF